jgi:hypothetical protein
MNLFKDPLAAPLDGEKKNRTFLPAEKLNRRANHEGLAPKVRTLSKTRRPARKVTDRKKDQDSLWSDRSL